VLKVLVSQRVDWLKTRAETRDALDQRLVDWLLQVGVLAVPVPNSFQSQGELVPWIESIAPHAVVLSGGNDIGSCPARDATEIVLLDYAAEHDLPLLGICRGMQMMACYAGAKLVRVMNHAGTRHSFGCIRTGAELPSEVNSYHDWAIENCPSDYEVLAVAQDGTIEMMRHIDRLWEGWMWHPERETPFNALDIERARHRLNLGRY